MRANYHTTELSDVQMSWLEALPPPSRQGLFRREHRALSSLSPRIGCSSPETDSSGAVAAGGGGCAGFLLGRRRSSVAESRCSRFCFRFGRKRVDDTGGRAVPQRVRRVLSRGRWAVEIAALRFVLRISHVHCYLLVHSGINRWLKAGIILLAVG